jgi:hypothetical protein
MFGLRILKLVVPAQKDALSNVLPGGIFRSSFANAFTSFLYTLLLVA